MTFDEYIRRYLDAQGVIVKGASVASSFPANVGAPLDVTQLLRESFKYLPPQPDEDPGTGSV